MAPRAPHRVHSEVIAADRAILRSVASLEGYAPMSAAYSTAAVEQIEAALYAAEMDEFRAERALAEARDQVRTLAYALHEAVSGVKDQVLAQFGRDSVAVHAIGLKQRSEYKRPARRKHKV